MPLSDVAIRNAKPQGKPIKLFDSDGLINPGFCRLKYRFGGREKLISLGSYPEISLGGARERPRTPRDSSRTAEIRAHDVRPSEQPAPTPSRRLQRIEARGKHETAHGVRSECGNVFRYASGRSRPRAD